MEVVLVGMFPELDKKQTIKNVKYYFEHDFPRLKAHAHMNIASIQSPHFDTVGTSGTARNTQENKVMDQLRAQELVTATYETIKICPDKYKYKTILKYCYLYGQSNAETMEVAGYASTRYYECKNNAFLYFAEAFQDYYDLQVFS